MLNPKLPDCVPHKPEVPQAVFLSLGNREALYGGAAGGGKSDALLMAALQHIHIPNYSAILLRRTYKDLSLPDAIMDRARRWLQGTTEARWNGDRREFRWANGSTLVFGHLENENDKYRYQGAAFQYIGFDELTQFTETQYMFLTSRLRRLKAFEATPRMRAASNPNGLGHDWVYNRFIPKIDERTGKLIIPRDKTGEARLFVPAKLTDNPHLDQEEYMRSLNELDDVLRAQLVEGSWTITPSGDFFNPESLTRYIDDLDWEEYRWVRYWDLAATEAKQGRDPDYTAGALVGRSVKTGLTVIADMQRVRERPDKIEALIARCAAEDPRGTAIRMEQEGGASGVMAIDHYSRKILYGYDFKGARVTGAKDVRARAFAAQANKGNVYLVRALWNSSLVSECYSFPKGAHDDQVDAISGAVNELARLYVAGSASVPATVGSHRVGSTYDIQRPRLLARG
jgi:predicted phage terminase large subunit-like protein